MQLRQWITFFNSPHWRLPQTPILFQQSLSWMEFTELKLRFGKSVFISFSPEYGGHGFAKFWPRRSRRFYPSVVRSVSAHHNDQAQDRAPSDKTHSRGADLPHYRGSIRVNEKRVRTGQPHAKRLHRLFLLLLAALCRPVVRPEPNQAPTYFRVSSLHPPLSEE